MEMVPRRPPTEAAEAPTPAPQSPGDLAARGGPSFEELLSAVGAKGVAGMALLADLQGYWEDLASGFVIEINGCEADYNDGTGPWEATLTSDGLCLRSSTFVGAMPGLIEWRRPDGSQMVWARADHVIEDPTWAEHFLRYKAARIVLRRHMVASLKEEDYSSAASLQEAWHTTWGYGKDVTPSQELRLAAGRYFVQGAMVRHTRHKLRAVILGCEPWVRATHAKRMSEAEREMPEWGRSYRSQPLYCCLIDDRDVPGGGVVFIPERDLEPADDAYPLESRFADALLEAEDGIRGYVPKQPLRAAAQRQMIGIPFMLLQ